MAKAKKKAAKKKAAAKPAKKKTVAKRKPATRAQSKSTVKKNAGKKKSVKASGSGVRLGVSFELDERLRNLATQMDKSLEEILIQALTEFADNWEDHMRTVRNLNSGDDRMQLSVPDEDAP